MAERNEVEIRVKFLRDGKVVSGVLGDLRKLRDATGDVGAKAVLMGNLYTKAFESVIRGARAAAAAVASTVGEGLRFNQSLESSKYAMSGLLYQFSNVTDSTERWKTSLNDAVVLQERLKIMALQTAGTYEDLVSTIQTGLAPGLQAGLQPEQVAQIGLRVSQATGAMGLASHMSMQEMRALMTGAIDRNATIAKALGITGEDIANWKAAGTLFEELEARMVGFARAAEEAQGSMAFLRSNLVDAYQQLTGEGSIEAFDRIKDTLKEIFSTFVDLSDEEAVFNEDLLSIVRSLADAFAAVLASLAPMAAETLPSLALAVRVAVGAFAALATGASKAVELIAGAFSIVLDQVMLPFLKRLRDMVAEAKNFVGETVFSALGGDAVLGGFDRLIAGTETVRKGLTGTSVAAGEASERFADLFATQVEGYAKVENAAKKAQEGTYGGGRGAIDPEEIAKAQKELVKFLDTYEQMAVAAEREAAALQLTNDRARAILEAEFARIDANEYLIDQLDRIAELYLFDPALAEKAAAALEDAYTKRIKAIGDKLRQALIAAGTALVDAHWAEAKSGAATLAEVDPRLNAATLELVRERKAFEKVAARFERGVASVSDAIYGAIMDGADGFVRALGSAFNQKLPELLDSAIRGLVTGVFGGTLTQDEASGAWGIVDAAGKFSALTEKQTKQIQNFGKAVEIASAAAGIYSNAQGGTKKQGAIGGAVSGAVYGATFGPVGAVIGAVLGAALGYFGGSDPKKYGFAVANPIGPAGGAARLENVRGLGPDQIKAVEAQINETRDAFWNAYATILIRGGAAADIAKIAEQAGKGVLPYISKPGGVDASADFMEQYQAWLTNTLPDTIAVQFRESMQGIYTTLGMSIERFDDLWEQFDRLDPKKAAQFWAAMLDMMLVMRDVFAYYDRLEGKTSDFLGDPLFSRGESAMLYARNRSNQTFRTNVGDLDEEIRQLGASLEHLVGEGQIQAAQQLASLMQQRMEAEIAYMNELLALSKSIDESFDALRRNLTLEGMVDPTTGEADVNAQIAYLKEYLDSLYQRIGSATTPEELAQINSEIMSTINQILQIAGGVSPEFAASIREWLMAEGGVLDLLQGALQDRITALADDAAASGDELIEALRPVWETFIEAVDGITSVIDGPGTGNPDGEGGSGPLVPSLESAGEAAATFAATLTEASESVATAASTFAASIATLQQFQQSVFDAVPREDVRRRRRSA